MLRCQELFYMKYGSYHRASLVQPTNVNSVNNQSYFQPRRYVASLRGPSASSQSRRKITSKPEPDWARHQPGPRIIRSDSRHHGPSFVLLTHFVLTQLQIFVRNIPAFRLLTPAPIVSGLGVETDVLQSP